MKETVLVEERTWVTKYQETILIKDMTDSHLDNSIQMMKRNGFVSEKTHNFYLSSVGPSGDMASYAFEQEQMRVFSSKISKVLDWLEEEKERRKEVKS